MPDHDSPEPARSGLQWPQAVLVVAMLAIAAMPVVIHYRRHLQAAKRTEAMVILKAIYITESAYYDPDANCEGYVPRIPCVPLGYDGLFNIGFVPAYPIKFYTANTAHDELTKTCSPESTYDNGKWKPCTREDATYDPHISLIIRTEGEPALGRHFSASMCGDLNEDGIALDRVNTTSSTSREPVHCFDDIKGANPIYNPYEAYNSMRTCAEVQNLGSCRY